MKQRTIDNLNEYFRLIREIKSEVTTFAELDKTIRDTINPNKYGLTDEEFNRSISVFGVDLE